MRQRIQVTRELDICRRRECTFLLQYFSHKGAWDYDEIYNEIQPTQQLSNIKEIASVKTSIVMNYEL